MTTDSNKFALGSGSFYFEIKFSTFATQQLKTPAHIVGSTRSLLQHDSD